MHGSFVTGRACLGWSDYFHRHCDVILHACTAQKMLQWSKISIMSSSFYPTNIKRFHYKGRGSVQRAYPFDSVEKVEDSCLHSHASRILLRLYGVGKHGGAIAQICSSHSVCRSCGSSLESRTSLPQHIALRISSGQYTSGYSALLSSAEALLVLWEHLLPSRVQVGCRGCRARCRWCEAVGGRHGRAGAVLSVFGLLSTIPPLVVHHPLCHQLQAMLQSLRIGVLLLHQKEY